MVVGLLLAVFILADVALLIFFLLRSGNSPPPEPKPETKPAGPTPRWHWLIWASFGLVWSAGTIFFDAIAVRGAVQQYRSLSFDSVEGKVVKCAVVVNDDGEGTAFDVDIEFVYRVRNQEYRGRRVRYYKLWERDWVSRFVEEHPPRSPITVYYDPTDPAEAVLLRETDGGLLWFSLFLVPFNLTMVFLIATAIYVRRVGGTTAKLPFVVNEKNERLHICLATIGPASSSLVTLFATALVAAVFVALCGGMPPSLLVMEITWGIVLATSAWVYWRVARRIAAGKNDLILDPLWKTLSLPVLLDGTGPVVVPLADVVSADVVAVHEEDEPTKYVPTVRWRDAAGAMHESKLVNCSDEADAERLAAWIRSKVGNTG
jgi:hypothetical protein